MLLRELMADSRRDIVMNAPMCYVIIIIVIIRIRIIFINTHISQ